MVSSVVVEHEHDRVEEDEEKDDVFEPFPGDEPHEASSEFAIL